MNHFAKAVDNLDAAVFSGDGLFDAKNRDLFRQSMERWQRKLIEWEEIAAEVAELEALHGQEERPDWSQIQRS